MKSPLEIAFAEANKNKFGKMKLRYENLIFSAASPSSINYGAIYVKNTENIYLGKIKDNHFLDGKGCSVSLDDRANIRYCMDNPSLAATTYGTKTGNCSICGRTLTAKESLERKIGPICAEKFGFFVGMIGKENEEETDSI